MARDDGGNAFPALDKVQQFDDDRGGYVDVYQPMGGMALRDYFAAKVMAGMIASYSGENVSLPDDDYAAKRAYRYADAMLAERLK